MEVEYLAAVQLSAWRRAGCQRAGLRQASAWAYRHREGTAGREEVYKTLRITKAVLASVRTLTSGGPKDVREEVTLSFEQGNLEAKGPDANPMLVERWMGIQK